MKNEELIKKWLTDQLTEEEGKRLKESEEFATMEKIWDDLTIATPPNYNIEDELERFHSSHHKQGKVIKVSWQRRWVGIAASIILLTVIGFLLLQPSSDTNTILLSEDLRAYYLPDSSRVTLNKGSELTYDSKGWFSSRKVQLVGEGFFQVKSGSAFEVATTGGTVTVLGTAFNVKQRSDYFEVICYEGKVGIKTPQQNFTLGAGDGYRDAARDEERFQVVLSDEPEWLSGKSSFFRTPYYIVLEELENQYGITIETKNLDLNNTFTGSFPNNNLNVALDAITIPSGYLYQKEQEKVLISGEKE